MLLFIYVDYLLIIGISAAGLRGIKSSLREELFMTDIGLLREFICLKVIKNIWES